jgi:hypothetical protein
VQGNAFLTQKKKMKKLTRTTGPHFEIVLDANGNPILVKINSAIVNGKKTKQNFNNAKKPKQNGKE